MSSSASAPSISTPAHSGSSVPGRRGLILLNLGTPDGAPTIGPSVSQVRRYLREFLLDPFVVDISAPLRWLLVHAVILPTRPAKSAEAYRKIWTERGSPLAYYLDDLVQGVASRLGADWEVVPAMRYGSPSIASALKKLQSQGIHDALVVPLYPQYSLAATESSIVECRRQAEQVAPGMRLRFYPAFYGHSAFISAFEDVIRSSLDGYDYDHLLLSFHGLPERQVKKIDPTGAHCQAAGSCCDQIVEANRNCYRAQCFHTARELARRLGIPEDRYTVCFQSRLGRTPWIQPYTDHLYQQLAARGVKRVAVACPAFVADCLETLEEIRIRGKEEFIRLGGEDLRLIPSLNASPSWMDALTAMVLEESRSGQGLSIEQAVLQ